MMSNRKAAWPLLVFIVAAAVPAASVGQALSL